MSLSPGTRLGPYEILSPLGTGGMGEVYRAKDTRLGREIAIKILPAEVSADPERLDRFEREARSASALNHPNIVTIHDVGRTDFVSYIGMELVEGGTLREVLAAGPLPTKKLLHIAAQAADGLANAHAAGIVHRDLKPENLMVSRDGFVKILDFGLAKPAASAEVLPEAATAGLLSRSGVILGTVGYMSPEQASGRPVDFRSDQFSFGSVLYEMATGKRAFQRDTPPETLVAIIRDEPEAIASVNPQVPPPLCWIVERCLAKDPEERYASTRDLARDLATLRDRLLDVPSKRLDVRPSNLPMQRTPFVGRKPEAAAVKELLLRQDVRLLTLTGPAGIGKTRLALEVAGDLAGHFSAGVYFVPLAPVGDPGLLASAIAQPLGLRETAGQTLLEALKEHLRESLRSPMLMLFDNFEHLAAAAPLMAELLATGPHLKVLVTSRAALHVYGEQEFPVPPLALPEARSLSSPEALSAFSAVALFVQSAVAVKPDFEVTKENASALAEICARLDGLPLAIELAAARVKLLPLSAIRARLEDRLQLLTGGARDLPARQQTLRGALDWSYDLLSPAEQTLFRRLSVFVGGCTLEAAEAVGDTKGDLGLSVLDGMASLVDKSLMQRNEKGEGEPRFVMLNTIREYGLERLAESGEEAPTRRAHAAYGLVLAEEGASERDQSDRTEWLDRLETEHDNLRGALEWLTRSADASWGLRLGAALFRFWETREHHSEGRDRLAKILSLPGAAARTEARARALFAAGVLAGAQGDYASADALTAESLEIARESGDKWGIAVSLNARAVLARDGGDVAASRSLSEESLKLWRELGDNVTVARSLSNLANIVTVQGDHALARSLQEECLAIFRGLKDRTGAAWSLNHQGDAARELGDAAAARSLFEESLAEFRELGDRWGMAASLTDLGNLARDQGDYARSHSLYEESMAIFQELGHKRGVARLLESFASSAAAQSRPERSLKLAGAAAALRQTLGAPNNAAEQTRLEKGLEPARRALADEASTAAWMEGWAMPVEEAVQEALRSRPA